ncbi:MAG: DUF1993 domain-containing protein [Hyphomicrobiaceae bacterium]|nr:DUF1993 domain-containing protein [Hyphomicrobiaceae bacterium]
MPLSIYSISIPVYLRRLAALIHVLDKAEADCAARKIDPVTLIESRLYPDMLPLKAQVRLACNHAYRGAGRLLGEEPKSASDVATSFADLKATVSACMDELKGLDQARFEGAGEKELTVPVGDRQMTLSGADYVLHLSMPNFYFHVTTAYAILRHSGVVLGKGDFMGGA